MVLVRSYIDEDKIKESESKRKTEKDHLTLCYQDVLNSASGRKVLWDVLTWCGMFEGGLSVDLREAHYKEGRRDIGLELIRQINFTSKDAYVQMMLDARRQNA